MSGSKGKSKSIPADDASGKSDSPGRGSGKRTATVALGTTDPHASQDTTIQGSSATKRTRIGQAPEEETDSDNAQSTQPSRDQPAPQSPQLPGAQAASGNPSSFSSKGRNKVDSFFAHAIYQEPELLTYLMEKDRQGCLPVLNYAFDTYDRSENSSVRSKMSSDITSKYGEYKGFDLSNALLEGLADQVSLMYRSFLTQNGYMTRYMYPDDNFNAWDPDKLRGDRTAQIWKHRRSGVRTDLLLCMKRLEKALNTASQAEKNQSQSYVELQASVLQAHNDIIKDLCQALLGSDSRKISRGILQSRFDRKEEIVRNTTEEIQRNPHDENEELFRELKSARNTLDKYSRQYKMTDNDSWKPSVALLDLLSIKEKLAAILQEKLRSLQAEILSRKKMSLTHIMKGSTTSEKGGTADDPNQERTALQPLLDEESMLKLRIKMLVGQNSEET
jgi:hypothetical protein